MDAQTPAPPAAIDWHGRYTGERRRSRILGATAVATSLLAVAVGAWGLSSADTAGGGPAVGQFGAGQRQFGPPGTTGQQPDPLSQDLAGMLFNDDGSVNDELLAEFLGRLPGGLDEFLANAVSSGDLTEDQAAALLAAAGSDSGHGDV